MDLKLLEFFIESINSALWLHIFLPHTRSLLSNMISSTTSTGHSLTTANWHTCSVFATAGWLFAVTQLHFNNNMAVSWVVTWNGQRLRQVPPQTLPALVRNSWPSWPVRGGKQRLDSESGPGHKQGVDGGFQARGRKDEGAAGMHVKYSFYKMTEGHFFLFMYPDSNLGPASSSVQLTLSSSGSPLQSGVKWKLCSGVNVYVC